MINDFNNDFLKELENFIEIEEAKDLGIDVEADTLKIHSHSQADYFLGLLNKAQKEVEYINTICDAKIQQTTDRVNRFREQNISGLSSQINYYKMLLETYIVDELANSKKKSIKLPEGTLGIKKQADKIDYDEEIVIDYLKVNHPELVRVKTKEEIDKTSLKKLAESLNGSLVIDGKEVEGIKVLPQPDKFYIKSQI
jgi:hypothetical protein